MILSDLHLDEPVATIILVILVAIVLIVLLTHIDIVQLFEKYENHFLAFMLVLVLLGCAMISKANPCSAWSDGDCNSDMREHIE